MRVPVVRADIWRKKSMTDRGEKEIIKYLKSIADSLKDIRGVMYDIAPKKTISEDGNIVKAPGYLEEVMRRVLDKEGAKKDDTN